MEGRLEGNGLVNEGDRTTGRWIAKDEQYY